MKNQVQLIAYVDRLSGGGVADLHALLSGPLAGVFGGVHLLPFFHPIDGADAGFDPIDHAMVDPRFGSWSEVKKLSAEVEIMADLIVNHISAGSEQFKDFAAHGEQSRYAGLFLTFSGVFPRGATEAELLRIYRPRPGLPFTTATLRRGEKRVLWTTFTPQQLDIDVHHPEGMAYLRNILAAFHAGGVRIIRLDAAGYAVKKPGTSCFMIPETYEFIANLTKEARELGMEVLVEIHSYYKQQVEIARHVDRVYDFALPPLVLHTLYRRDARALKAWLDISPRNAITVLDTHDGIGVIDIGADHADPLNRPGLLTPAEIDSLVKTIHEKSNGQSRMATGVAASNLDLYQVNCTYYDALGRNDRDYLWARAIQFFCPGVPQVYYVGLLGGTNDLDLLARTRVGRDINRHYYDRSQVERAMQSQRVKKLVELIRFRNTHPAFRGEFHLLPGSDSFFGVEWRAGEEWARLEMELKDNRAKVSHSTRSGPAEFFVGI